MCMGSLSKLESTVLDVCVRICLGMDCEYNCSNGKEKTPTKLAVHLLNEALLKDLHYE